jgi:hypothetical protein
MNIKKKFPNLSPKQSDALRITFRILNTILASALIIILTIAFVYYANGYRIGKDGEIQVTGTVALRSSPSNSPVYIDGSRNGSTSKTFSSLGENTNYTFEVKRDGYHTWKKTLMIHTEKLTPLNAYLFKSDINVESSYDIDNDLVSIQNSRDNKNIYILTSEIISQTDNAELSDVEKPETEPLEATQDNKVLIYRLWKYNTNPRFWNPSENPQILLEQQFITDTQTNPLVDISPSGEYIRLSLNGQPNNEKVENIKIDSFDTSVVNTYMIKTNSLVEDITKTKIDLEKFIADYSITWSEDSNYLILDSEDEILGYNLESERRILLLKKDVPNVVWQSDSEGNFYHVEKTETETSKDEFFTLFIQELAGSKKEILIEKIYTHNDSTYLEGDLVDMQTPFMNSPENSRFVGDIVSMSFVNTPDGIFITTNLALYWYDINEEEYILISNSPSEFISVNPNKTKALFTTETSLGIFTFDKEEQDHTEEIGTQFIFEIDRDKPLSLIKWHGNSEYIFFSEDQKVRVIDDEGDNNIELLKSDNYFSFSPDGESLFTLSTSNPNDSGEELNTLSKYQIH